VNPGELFAVVRSLRQKGVVLNIWASWCAPCREELAMLAKVSKAYQPRGITVLPLSVDEPENDDKIAEVLHGLGFAPPYYVAKPPIAALKEALYAGWPGNIPVSFLLDGDAGRRYFFNAEVYEEELTPKLDAMLAGTLIEGKSNFGVAPGAEL
jgi:thiol-disulfide isomerase/thioredoxin